MIGLERKKILKTLLAAPLALIHSAYIWIGNENAIPIAEIVMDQIFGRIGLDSSGTVILTIENLCFSVLFNFMMAGHIADCFRYGCVYVFTRIRNRTGWGVKCIVELVVYACLYLAIYILVTALVASRVSSLPLSVNDVAGLTTIYIYSLFVLINTTLAVNFLAMRMGVLSSFLLVQGVVLLLFLLALVTRSNPFWVAVNPVSCVGILNYELGVRIGVISTNLIITMLLVWRGLRLIQSYDVALVDPELN